MTLGISAYGVYIPKYRIGRDIIAKEWGTPPMGGEKAVANYDEDSLTMAVEASLNCLGNKDPKTINGLYFASTNPPYREKQAATTVASAVDLSKEIRTADFCDSLRASTSALIAALDAIRAGTVKKLLVVAADCRMGEPDSATEQMLGDGAGAILLDTENVIAEILDSYSLADEFIGTWRADSRQFIQTFPGAFELRHGYTRVMGEILKKAFTKFALTPQDLAKVVIYSPNPRGLAGIAGKAGFDPKAQIQDSFWLQLGDTGTAAPLMMLSAALEGAKPGDKILLVSYGDGSDAFLLQATSEIEKFKVKKDINGQIANKRPLGSYGKYSRFRNLAIKETPPEASETSPVVFFRDEKQLLPLYGEKCNKCNTLQYPRDRVCVECRSKDEFTDVKLAKDGKIFTFTHD
jgi:3-hydroxy-3-methylglutaryl CoA synthase